MVLVAFVCFLALVVAWLLASNAEGVPEKVAEPAPQRTDVQAVAEIA